MARKQPRPPRRNRKKNRSIGRRLLGRAALCVELLAAAAAVVLASCGFILMYDLATQSELLPVKQITVEGRQRLSAEEVVRRAGVAKGDNILAVNLSKLRRRLISHPWIAEAQVRRDIPSGIRISIREHQALAVVDLDGRFLLNTEGLVFKQWEPESDPPRLPTITGLAASDLAAAGEKPTEAGFSWPGRAEAAGDNAAAAASLEAVMRVLELGRNPDGVLPNRIIHTIQADPAVGLTLSAFDPPRVISLGFGGYAGKYRLLAQLMNDRRVPEFTHIDLQDVNRIVIKPAGKTNRTAGS